MGILVLIGRTARLLLVLSEFLPLNYLYLLEGEAIEVERSEESEGDAL